MCSLCYADLKAKIFALGEWYSCRGLAVVANSGVLTLGFNLFTVTTKTSKCQISLELQIIQVTIFNL